MSQTKKASLMELKKYFMPDKSAVEFSEEKKKLSPEDLAELQDLLGTEIEEGRIKLA